MQKGLEMAPGAPSLTHENVVEFWRRRFRRQRHVNAGVRSLLRKYGTSSSSRAVATDFLLTLMGNLIVADACFYRASSDDRVLHPGVAFGATPLDALPSIGSDTVLAQIAREGGPPRLLNSLPRAATDDGALGPVCERFKLFAPLHFENRLQGLVFLGPRVSGGAFTDNDIELIEALCAVTAAVLQYMDRRRIADAPEDQAGRVLVRCQEVAGAVADHLERSLKTIETLSASTAFDGDADARLAKVSQQVASMRYLLSSLRLIANDPTALAAEKAAACDAVEAVQSAAMAYRPSAASESLAVSFGRKLDGQLLVAVDAGVIDAAVRETIDAAFEHCMQVEQLSILIDRADGLPSEIGGPERQDAERQPMMRVSIETREAGATAGPGESTGMKMLADNLKAFQTVLEPAPGQSAIMQSGGTIVWRRDRVLTTYLIYLPLASD